MMYYPSEKHRVLSKQLTAWWGRQAEFKSKKALAGLLKVHPDTLGDYFSGRKFPRPEIANRLHKLSDINCLELETGGSPSSEATPQEPTAAPLLPSEDPTASMREPQSLDVGEGADLLEEKRPSGESLVELAGQLPGVLSQKGARSGQRSAVISLYRTVCPLCGHDIGDLRRCAYCGQSFVRANVPLEKGEKM